MKLKGVLLLETMHRQFVKIVCPFLSTGDACYQEDPLFGATSVQNRRTLLAPREEKLKSTQIKPAYVQHSFEPFPEPLSPADFCRVRGTLAWLNRLWADPALPMEF
jgi:hypothetical protein